MYHPESYAYNFGLMIDLCPTGSYFADLPALKVRPSSENVAPFMEARPPKTGAKTLQARQMCILGTSVCYDEGAAAVVEEHCEVTRSREKRLTGPRGSTLAFV
jgi:hypothetical protein